MSNYRNRKLLDIAHEAPCFLNLEGCKSGHPDYPSVPCHSDLLRHGRGASYKSHDALAVPGCPICHAQFTRSLLKADGYEAVWVRAIEKYLPWLWENGKIEVA